MAYEGQSKQHRPALRRPYMIFSSTCNTIVIYERVYITCESLTCKARQVIHFVLQPSILVLREVREAAVRSLHQLGFHVPGRFVK